MVAATVAMVSAEVAYSAAKAGHDASIRRCCEVGVQPTGGLVVQNNLVNSDPRFMLPERRDDNSARRQQVAIDAEVETRRLLDRAAEDLGLARADYHAIAGAVGREYRAKETTYAN